MAQLKSENIEVFPTTRRASGRRFTEEVVSTTVLASSDQDSFLTHVADDGTSQLEFVIHGYVFKIISSNPVDLITNLFPSTSSSEIWAYIDLLNTNSFEEIDGVDDSSTGKYTGLQFLDSTPATTSNRYILKILEKNTSGNWVPYTDSYIKYNQNSVYGLTTLQSDVNTLKTDDIVDGGEL